MNRWQMQAERQRKEVAQQEKEAMLQAQMARLKSLRSRMSEEELFYSEFAERIRKLREKGKYTGEGEALELNQLGAHLSQSDISKIERLEETGKTTSKTRKPSLFEAVCFAKLHKKGIEDLLGLPDPTPPQKQLRSSVSYTGLSEDAISTIRSLKDDQKQMFNKILTCKDEKGESLLGEILSEMIQADQQHDEMLVAEDDFDEWHKELVYFDSVCRKHMEVLSLPEIKETDEYESLMRACHMARASYPHLYFPVLDQEKHLKTVSSYFDDLLQNTIRSCRSEIIEKNGTNYADVLANATLYGAAVRNHISQGGSYYDETTYEVKTDDNGVHHFSFPMETYFKMNPTALRDFDEIAYEQEETLLKRPKVEQANAIINLLNASIPASKKPPHR